MSSTSHDGSEPNALSMSQGDAPRASKCSATAILHESAESSASSELGVGRPNAVGRKLLPPIRPGAAPAFVNAKQYEPMLRWRKRRARAAANRARRSNGLMEVKKRVPRGSKGRTKGVDFYWPFVATNEDEEHVGEAAYDSILNLEAPDFTSLLRIMMGDKYHTKAAEQFKNVSRLEAPHFATILTVMNNANYNEQLDDGHYDVDKVLLKSAGW
ncbi:hypothetical protein ACP70R_018509 [Stipagrostis hirtigluma subsp. patula]